MLDIIIVVNININMTNIPCVCRFIFFKNSLKKIILYYLLNGVF